MFDSRETRSVFNYNNGTKLNEPYVVTTDCNPEISNLGIRAGLDQYQILELAASQSRVFGITKIAKIGLFQLVNNKITISVVSTSQGNYSRVQKCLLLCIVSCILTVTITLYSSDIPTNRSLSYARSLV